LLIGRWAGALALSAALGKRDDFSGHAPILESAWLGEGSSIILPLSLLIL
jgi:hypothetical protein